MVTLLAESMPSLADTFLNCLDTSMDAEINMADIRDLALKHLRRDSGSLSCERRLGAAVLSALVQSGVDLKAGPSLDEMKTLLADVARLAHLQGLSKHTAA